MKYGLKLSLAAMMALVSFGGMNAASVTDLLKLLNLVNTAQRSWSFSTRDEYIFS